MAGEVRHISVACALQRSEDPSEIDGDPKSILTGQGEAMARRSRQSVQKRLRERKKMEKAEHKRGIRAERQAEESAEGSRVASADDLAGYGLVTDSEPEPGRD